MSPSDFDFKSGQVTFWELDFLERTKPLVDQLNGLKEDLVQIEFPRELLDVGWYPEFSEVGAFTVKLVRDFNWDEPIFEVKCRTVDELVFCIDKAIALVQR